MYSNMQMYMDYVNVDVHNLATLIWDKKTLPNPAVKIWKAGNPVGPRPAAQLEMVPHAGLVR